MKYYVEVEYDTERGWYNAWAFTSGEEYGTAKPLQFAVGYTSPGAARDAVEAAITETMWKRENSMTPERYVEAAKQTLVVPEEHVMSYCVLEIIEEAAELRSAFRDGQPRGKLIDELGDVVYALFVLLDHTGHINNARITQPVTDLPRGIEETLLDLLTSAHSIGRSAKRALRGDRAFEPDFLYWILADVHRICHQLNVTLEEVMQVNIVKLSKRAAEGTIRGENRDENA